MPKKPEGEEKPQEKSKKAPRRTSKRRAASGESKKARQKKSTKAKKPAEPVTVEESPAEAVEEQPQAAPEPEPAEEWLPEEQRAAPEAEASQEAVTEEAEEPEAAPTSVHDLLREFAIVLGLFAWQRLGLMMDPGTGKIHRDLSQARIAIDTVAYLVQQIGDDIPEDQKRALRATLADLRINFVEQSKML